jgi:hypothetical protein
MIYRVISSGYFESFISKLQDGSKSFLESKTKSTGLRHAGVHIELLGDYLEEVVDQFFGRVFQEDVTVFNDGSLDYLIYPKITSFLFMWPLLFFPLFIKSIALILILTGVVSFFLIVTIIRECMRSHATLEVKRYKYLIGIDPDAVKKNITHIFKLYYAGITNGTHLTSKAHKKQTSSHKHRSKIDHIDTDEHIVYDDVTSRQDSDGDDDDTTDENEMYINSEQFVKYDSDDDERQIESSQRNGFFTNSSDVFWAQNFGDYTTCLNESTDYGVNSDEILSVDNYFSQINKKENRSKPR